MSEGVSKGDYRVVPIYGSGQDPHQTAETMTRHINRLEGEGWVLVAVSGAFHYFRFEGF